MSIISGTRRAMKELVDGTIRIQIDIDPQYREEFFTTFSQIDMPVAIAPLKADFEQANPQESTKISGLTLLAVEWCKEPKFWEWINITQFRKPSAPHYEANEKEARDWVLQQCEIKSRKELNSSTEAAAIFQQEIRGPYMQWCQENFK